MRVALLLPALLACGCRTSHPEHAGYWIRSFHPGGRAESRPAPYEAEYVLLARPPLPPGEQPAAPTPEGAGTEVLARALAAGEKLGFELEDEALFAVTGPERTALETGRYCWHMRPGTGPSEATIRTRSMVKLAVGTAVVAGLVGGGLAAVSLGF